MASLAAHHIWPCIETLDPYDRCAVCLRLHGRRASDPWKAGDEQFVPPAKQRNDAKICRPKGWQGRLQ